MPYIFLILLSFCFIFQLNLDTVWTVIFNVPISKSVSALMSDNSIQMCSDAALILLAMVRSLLNPVSTHYVCFCIL